MAILYFDGAVDNDWNTLGNWWTNSSHTTPAAGLPTSSDSVVVSSTVWSNGGSEPTVVNLTANSTSGQTQLNIPITVTGQATINSYSYLGSTLTGNATFDGGAENSGTVTGNATFTNGAMNYGTVSGNATFSNNSSNALFGSPSSGGVVSGNATFDATSGNRGGTVSGNATFTGATYSAATYWQFPTYGLIQGSVTFSSPTPVTLNMQYMEYYENASGWTFTGGTATWNMIGCTVGSYFSEGSKAVVKGNCNMTALCQLYGDVTGNLFMHTSIHYQGHVGGTATYEASAVRGDPMGWAHPAGNPNVQGQANFRGGSYAERAFFAGPCTFDPASAATQILYIPDMTINSASVSIIYGKGVNGSSILGIV